ncbi:MAG: acyl-CoA dehydrogenase family protein [Actinobacteria bacterium]|nr:acyl-CoA dehydrogenase family protein [Actinomycetota bacterium]
MDLELSEDQALLAATTRRFLDAESPTTAVRALEHDPRGFDPTVWRKGAELGWTSLLVAEADGGGSVSGRGVCDLALVAEEFGRSVAPGPLLPVNVVAEAISRSAGERLRAEVLPGLLDGTAIAAWAGPMPVTADVDGDRTVLTGRIPIVEAAAQADHVLVTFVDRDGTTGQALLPTTTDGMTITPLGGLDLVRRFASIDLDGVAVAPDQRVGDDASADDAIERQVQVAAVLQCAEVAGAIDQVFTMTVEYLGDRYSMGRPLASYQALKHRLAEHKLTVETCHAITTAAARAVADRTDEAADLASVAQTWLGTHATELVQDCIQLHGGIGVTWEHDLHLYLRRVTVDRATHGTPEDHADRIADLLLGAAS